MSIQLGSQSWKGRRKLRASEEGWLSVASPFWAETGPGRQELCRCWPGGLGGALGFPIRLVSLAMVPSVSARSDGLLLSGFSRGEACLGFCSLDFLSLRVPPSQKAPQASACDPKMPVFLTLRMEKAHFTDGEIEEGFITFRVGEYPQPAEVPFCGTNSFLFWKMQTTQASLNH